jgi:hypothetical protein
MFPNLFFISLPTNLLFFSFSPTSIWTILANRNFGFLKNLYLFSSFTSTSFSHFLLIVCVSNTFLLTFIVACCITHTGIIFDFHYFLMIPLGYLEGITGDFSKWNLHRGPSPFFVPAFQRLIKTHFHKTFILPCHNATRQCKHLSAVRPDAAQVQWNNDEVFLGKTCCILSLIYGKRLLTRPSPLYLSCLFDSPLTIVTITFNWGGFSFASSHDRNERRTKNA